MDTKLKEGDYSLEEGTVWITIRNISLRVSIHEEGVSAEFYGLGREDDPALAFAELAYAEATPEVTAE